MNFVETEQYLSTRARVESLTEERNELEAALQCLDDDYRALDKKIDGDHDLVRAAINDLRTIEEVPLGDLVGYVEAVIENLRVVLA